MSGGTPNFRGVTPKIRGGTPKIRGDTPKIRGIPLKLGVPNNDSIVRMGFKSHVGYHFFTCPKSQKKL